jgi:hypothetical protein
MKINFCIIRFCYFGLTLGFQLQKAGYKLLGLNKDKKIEQTTDFLS